MTCAIHKSLRNPLLKGRALENLLNAKYSGYFKRTFELGFSFMAFGCNDSQFEKNTN